MEKTPSSNYKVRFNDCDMFGHLNNARYLDYMINARQDHLKDSYDFDFNSYYKNGQGWVISYQEIQYLKPAFFDEVVNVQSAVLDADEHSLYVEVLMMNETRTHLKAILRSRLTFIDLKTGRKEKHKPELQVWAKSLILGNAMAEGSIQERITQVLAGLKAANAADSTSKI